MVTASEFEAILTRKINQRIAQGPILEDAEGGSRKGVISLLGKGEPDSNVELCMQEVSEGEYAIKACVDLRFFPSRRQAETALWMLLRKLAAKIETTTGREAHPSFMGTSLYDKNFQLGQQNGLMLLNLMAGASAEDLGREFEAVIERDVPGEVFAWAKGLQCLLVARRDQASRDVSDICEEMMREHYAGASSADRGNETEAL